MKPKKTDLHLNSHLISTTKRRKRRHGRLIADGFTVFKRRGAAAWYFYVVENGKRRARSTKETDKSKAEAIARKYMAPKPTAGPGAPARVTLREFTKDFFVWGKCPWIAAQLAADRSFSKGVAIGRRTHLLRYILPAFGDRLVAEIGAKELRDWLVMLKGTRAAKGRPLSGQTKNHVRYTLKIIFSEAVLAKLIPSSPVIEFRNVALNRKERDAFTLEDLAKLFPVDRGELFHVWGDDACMAILFTVLAATGVRSGEGRALQWRHVGAEVVAGPDGTAVEVPYLAIEQSVKFYSGEIGSTKSGKARPVYLPERARGALEWWRANTYGGTGPNDLVFPGADGARPLDEDLLRARFKKALVRAGVDAAGRNLVPHSFRHAYVTRSKKALPADLLLLMAGHADERVQKGYLHPALEEHLREMAGARLLIEAAAKW